MQNGMYAIGFIVIIMGVAYLAHLMHIPQTYIVAAVVILVGMGILMGVQNTRSGKN